MSDAAKILEIGPFPPPANGWAVRIKFVKEALESSGHLCTVLNLGENRRIPSAEYECVRSAFEYVRKLLVYVFKGYVPHLHINGESPKGCLLARAAAVFSLAARRQPVLTFHAGVEQTYFPKSKSTLMAPIFRWLFRRAQVILCNDMLVKQRIVEYGVAPEKIVPVPAFSRQYLDGEPAALEPHIEEQLRGGDPIVFTYVECRPEYALEALFSAVAAAAEDYPNLRLVVVGASKDAAEINRLAQAANVADRIVHLGAVERPAFLALLRRANAYLRSARTEGVSSATREALALGTPVVANHTDHQPQGVWAYTFGDTADMAAMLRRALQEGRLSKPALSLDEIPDTVAQEAELLINAALGCCVSSAASSQEMSPSVAMLAAEPSPASQIQPT
jgi:glycosyltransferase involved in cell wall biosynthesis